MKNKSLKILLAIVAGSFLLGTPLYAQFSDSRIGSIRHDKSDKQAAEAKGITKAEAEKKYPMKGGAYPTGDRDPHDAVARLCGIFRLQRASEGRALAGRRRGIPGQSRPLTSVERLAFGWHYNARIQIRDNEIRQLTGWTKLRDLRCGQCGLASANLSQFPKLENLDLSDNPFTNKGMEGLAGLPGLRRLMLRDALVTDDGLKAIAGLTHLEELDLSGVRITDKGIESLRNLKAMRRLSLLGGDVSDAAMDVIAGMEHLEILNLYRTKVTNTGLAKLQNLKQLTVLDLRYSRVTSNGLESLRASLPKARIEFAGVATPPSKIHAAAKPASESEDAIAAWLKSLGGSATMSGPVSWTFRRPADGCWLSPWSGYRPMTHPAPMMGGSDDPCSGDAAHLPRRPRRRRPRGTGSVYRRMLRLLPDL